MVLEQVWWLVGTCFGFTLFGAWVGWECWGRRLTRCAPDAERWQWWRTKHAALCGMACARAAGLDLSSTYVTTPAHIDAVTDAARNGPQNLMSGAILLRSKPVRTAVLLRSKAPCCVCWRATWCAMALAFWIPGAQAA